MDDMIKAAKEFYEDEYNDSVLYAQLAKYEKNEELKREFLRLANIESAHAKFWHDFLIKRNAKLPKAKISRFKINIVKLLRKALGPGAVASLLEMGENSAIQKYYSFLSSYMLSEDEKAELAKVIVDELEHERFFYESKKKFHVENVRDLVLGMNDGLVEILGAVTGLSAVYVNNPF